MFKSRSKVLFITAILSAAYAAFIIAVVFNSKSETVGEAIGKALLNDYALMITAGAVFACLGFLLKAPWGALVSGILFGVGILCLPRLLMSSEYSAFALLFLILAFVGYSKQRAIKKAEESAKGNEQTQESK